MTFGVTTEGFDLPTQQDLLAQVEADEKANISPIIVTSAESPLGQINGIFTRQLAIAWEALEAVYKSNDPDAAEGDALTSIGKLTGTERRAATFSTTPCSVTTDAAITLLSGTHFASLNGDPSVRFTPVVDFVATGAGTTTNVQFRAENTGPVHAPSGQLTVIATPVTHWTGITNTADEVPGHLVDDDPTLRARRETELTAAGSSTAFAIAADLDKVTGIDSVTIFENDNDGTDSNGLPGHSFECVVADGVTPLAANNDIAQAIWDNKPAGIRAFGALSGTAHDRDPNTSLPTGAAHTVFFSRVSYASFYVDYTLVTDSGTYIGNTAFKALIAQRANEIFASTGATVYISRLEALAFEAGGVLAVESIRIGLTSSPTGTTDIVLGALQRPVFDSTRVTIT